ncbi:hypothetical protein QJQ45_007815 [Haematococcus lacustris]|nr:hypothetical protein QJQ45_007815 [Haematococcus lacustris]
MAGIRSLVEAAQPDLSPAQVDAVVAEINKRMTMGSKQCVLAAVLCLSVLLQDLESSKVRITSRRSGLLGFLLSADLWMTVATLIVGAMALLLGAVLDTGFKTASKAPRQDYDE